MKVSSNIFWDSVLEHWANCWKLPREAREIFKPKFQSGATGLFQNEMDSKSKWLFNSKNWVFGAFLYDLAIQFYSYVGLTSRMKLLAGGPTWILPCFLLKLSSAQDGLLFGVKSWCCLWSPSNLTRLRSGTAPSQVQGSYRYWYNLTLLSTFCCKGKSNLLRR